MSRGRTESEIGIFSRSISQFSAEQESIDPADTRQSTVPLTRPFVRAYTRTLARVHACNIRMHNLQRAPPFEYPIRHHRNLFYSKLWISSSVHSKTLHGRKMKDGRGRTTRSNRIKMQIPKAPPVNRISLVFEAAGNSKLCGSKSPTTNPEMVAL